MPCRRVRAQLALASSHDLGDGAGSAPERRVFRHLIDCVECRRLFASWRDQRARLAELARRAEVGLGSAAPGRVPAGFAQQPDRLGRSGPDGAFFAALRRDVHAAVAGLPAPVVAARRRHWRRVLPAAALLFAGLLLVATGVQGGAAVEEVDPPRSTLLTRERLEPRPGVTAQREWTALASQGLEAQRQLLLWFESADGPPLPERLRGEYGVAAPNANAAPDPAEKSGR